ncbi:35730_t:CDS:2, partial [Gigaspora margarita]
MERQLESIKSQVQRIATTLNEDESVSIERDLVTLQMITQKVTEYISIPARKTMAKKIRENITTYLLDLDCEEPRDFMLPPEVSGETWDEKLALKGKAVWRISKRVYQLFSTRGEEYLYIVEHISITVLEKMYDEDFSDR